MDFELRPLGVGEILDRALKLYLRNFGRLFGWSAGAMILSVVAVALAVGLVGLVAALVGGAAGGNDGVTVVLVIVGGVFAFVGYCFVVGLPISGLFIAGSELYLGREVSFGSLFRRGIRRAFPTGFAFLLGVIALYMGCACFIFPGIYILAPVCMMPVVATLEGRGAFASIRRSWALTRRHWGRILGAVLVAGAATIVWSVAVDVGMVVASGGLQGGAPGPLYFLLTLGVGPLLKSLAYPFGALALLIAYYDLRVRAEAFDLEMLAGQLAEASGGAA